MPVLPIIPRRRAEQDIEEAVDYYRDVAGTEVALDFLDDLEQAFGHLSQHPATGSPRYAQELDLPGVRSWPLTRFPYLVFYVEQPDHLDVWRALHAERDIPAWMQKTGED